VKEARYKKEYATQFYLHIVQTGKKYAIEKNSR
jgi:hypothetical protein